MKIIFLTKKRVQRSKEFTTEDCIHQWGTLKLRGILKEIRLVSCLGLVRSYLMKLRPKEPMEKHLERINCRKLNELCIKIV